jgi:hypothetical protein
MFTAYIIMNIWILLITTSHNKSLIFYRVDILAYAALNGYVYLCFAEFCISIYAQDIQPELK